MQFPVARGRELFHEHRGLAHRVFSPLAAPRIGPEVIAPEPEPIGREPDRAGELGDLRVEVGRLHPRVAAVLVDLVASGLHERQPVVRGRVAEGLLQHDGMGRADRREAAGLAPVLGLDDVVQWMARHRPLPAADRL